MEIENETVGAGHHLNIFFSPSINNVDMSFSDTLSDGTFLLQNIAQKVDEAC